MTPQGDLITLIDVHEDYDTSDGIKDRAEISRFEHLTSYSWADRLVDTKLLQTRWNENVPPFTTTKPLCEVPIAAEQPGSPLTWCPPSSTIKLNYAPSTDYRDYEHSLSLRHEMDDAVRYMDPMSTHPVYWDIDIFTSDRTLKMLLKFVQGDAASFQILMQKIGGTLFLVEKSNSAKTKMNLTYSVQEACTQWPGEKSKSHQRLIQYTFDGIRCLVRFEADGCLNKTDRLMAAALISDMARSEVSSSEQPDLVLQMSLQASTTMFVPSAFSGQLLTRPEAVEQFASKVPFTELHWSQKEAIAESRAKKEKLDAARAVAAAEDALAFPRAYRSFRGNISDHQERERAVEMERLVALELDKPKNTLTSPLDYHTNYLEQYPIVKFCTIVGVESEVAKKYLDMAGGEFQRAIDLFHNPQDIESLQKNQIARFIVKTKADPAEAQLCLRYWPDDYEKALRFHATRKMYPGQNIAGPFLKDEGQREKVRKFRQMKNATGVPHSALFALRCASEKIASNSHRLLNDMLLRLWITRIPGVITAYHDPTAAVTSFTYTDVRPQIRKWETDNQQTLAKLSALLKDVKDSVREGHKTILSVTADAKLEVRKAGNAEYDVLSPAQKTMWLRHSREEEEEGTADDNNNDDDDDDEGSDWNMDLEEDDHLEEEEDDDDDENEEEDDDDENEEEDSEEAKVRSVFSDTSSDDEEDRSDDEDNESEDGGVKL
jgi:hypothetical protein